MQTKTQKTLYYELELIADPTSKAENQALREWWMGIWHILIKALTAPNEPQVWSSNDWFGHTWWNVYLPRTGQITRFSSQEEARIWLEQNLYSA